VVIPAPVVVPAPPAPALAASALGSADSHPSNATAEITTHDIADRQSVMSRLHTPPARVEKEVSSPRALPSIALEAGSTNITNR
jgi:hypothetical protein